MQYSKRTVLYDTPHISLHTIFKAVFFTAHVYRPTRHCSYYWTPCI